MGRASAVPEGALASLPFRPVFAVRRACVLSAHPSHQFRPRLTRSRGRAEAGEKAYWSFCEEHSECEYQLRLSQDEADERMLVHETGSHKAKLNVERLREDNAKKYGMLHSPAKAQVAMETDGVPDEQRPTDRMLKAARAKLGRDALAATQIEYSGRMGLRESNCSQNSH